MNQYLFTYSDSLFLTLCKEIDYIKNRSRNIHYSLKTCQNKLLSKRLKLELNKLKEKRLEILNITENMFKINYDQLCTEFLLENIKRSNNLQQI